MQTAKTNARTKKHGKVVSSTAIIPTPEQDEPKIVSSEEREPIAETAAEPIPAASEPNVEAQPQADPKVHLLDLNQIVNSVYNPRKDMRQESLQELSDSIRQVGVLQPICVRPMDDGYEIVYGERRYWAAALAGLKCIPALIREMTDAEAEDAAITENLQREDVSPREEAAAYKRALDSGRHSIESLVGKFGKSETYIRARLKLSELIDALAEQLDKEEISVGVATEIAKYPADIQQTVYNEHFAEGCYASWKNTRIKEVARRLYEQYMTKLETYRFDKSECVSCQHNTANQVLFRDECSDGCAGCQNRECMMRKNHEYLMRKALKIQQDDPRTILATIGDTPVAVLETLEQKGYYVEELNYYLDYYDEAPERPEQPASEKFETVEDYEMAMEEFQAELVAFTEETQQLEFDVSEGRMRKYAIIGHLDVEVRYEAVEPEEVETVSEDGERKVFVTVVPDSPKEDLLRKDYRNRQICYERITADMKKFFSTAKVSNKPLLKEEQQMFFYAVMNRVGAMQLKQCGFKTKENSRMTDQERFTAAGHITDKQQAALMRTFLLDFFRATAPDYNCTDELLATQLMCRFADLNFEKESRNVQRQYLEIYEKRKVRLQDQIDALDAQMEAAAQEASIREVAIEPDDLPEAEPAEVPDTDVPQPAKEPLSIPADPEIEPEVEQSDVGIAA